MSDTATRRPTRRAAHGPEAESRTGGLTDEQVRASVGYRVDAPEGHLGVVEEVRLAGVPPRPLVLVVRALNRRYLLPAQRIARVLADERRVLLWPEPGFAGRSR
jgi:hypothetical protein